MLILSRVIVINFELQHCKNIKYVEKKKFNTLQFWLNALKNKNIKLCLLDINEVLEWFELKESITRVFYLSILHWEYHPMCLFRDVHCLLLHTFFLDRPDRPFFLGRPDMYFFFIGHFFLIHQIGQTCHMLILSRVIVINLELQPCKNIKYVEKNSPTPYSFD